MPLFVIMLIGLVCLFEFINGFHDTANAVATVIYTKSLKPFVAVAYSGVMNFMGVMVGGVGVAYSIVKLIPIVQINEFGLSMSILIVYALLLTAILRNFFTWYKGLPCSSSHTLIGSIIGAVIGFCLLKMDSFAIVNFAKIKDILLGLLISPIFGFGITLVIIAMFKKWYHKQALFHRPTADDHTPPWYMRGLLILSCGLVSFFHGSNDGQKGIGLGVAILALLLPAVYMPMIEAKTAPMWLIGIISVSLGLGTMIGWKRIVVTIGEKIGVDHLSYIQGAAAELVASFAIGVSTHYHLPVSTTHVLSSGVAGAMVGSGGTANIQKRTIRNIALAWIFTLPVCIGLSAGIVYFGGVILGL